MANVGNKFDNTRHAWDVEWDYAPNHGNSFQLDVTNISTVGETSVFY